MLKKLLILGGIVALLAVLVVAGARQAGRRGTKVYEEEARRVERLISTVKASGEIQPRVYVNISSQVPGQIVELPVKEGDRVRQHQVLVQLDPEQYRSNVTRLEAQLRLTRINLERERTALANHEVQLARQEALARDRVVSAEALDTARLLVDTSRIQVKGLEEQIRQAEADLVKSRDELAKTTLRAPMDGLVTRVNAKLGEQVIIGTMNNPGTVILVLSDMSEMLAEVKVDETEVTSVHPGQRSIVTVDAVTQRKFEGTVAEIAHTAVKERDVSRFVVKVSLGTEAPKDSVPAVARELPLPEPEAGSRGLYGTLRPGMTTHAAIHVASRKDALIVPLQAVVSRKLKDVEQAIGSPAQEKAPAAPAGGASTGSLAAEPAGSGGPSAAVAGGAGAASGAEGEEEVDVIFVDRAGKAEMMRVRTGLSDEFNVEILDAALQPGDKVIIGPYRTLKKLKHGDALQKVEKDEDLKEES